MATHPCQATVLGPDFQEIGLCCPENNTGIERTQELLGLVSLDPVNNVRKAKIPNYVRKLLSLN